MNFPRRSPVDRQPRARECRRRLWVSSIVLCGCLAEVALSTLAPARAGELNQPGLHIAEVGNVEFYSSHTPPSADAGAPPLGESDADTSGALEQTPEKAKDAGGAQHRLQQDIAGSERLPSPEPARGENPLELPPLPASAAMPAPLPEASALPQAEDSSAPPRKDSLAIDSFAQRLGGRSAVWLRQRSVATDRIWMELEYEPRLVARLGSSFDAKAEVLLRTSVAGERGVVRGAWNGGVAVNREGARVQWDRRFLSPKDVYVAWRGALDVLVGWQVIAWAHSDGLRPLDVFQAEDLTDRLRVEPLGVPAISATYGTDALGVEFVFLPRSVFSYITTEPDSPFSVAASDSPSPAIVDLSDRGGFSLADAEIGSRLTWNGQVWDLAIMAARTRDRLPSSFRPQSGRSPNTLYLAPDYDQFWMIGATAGRSFGSVLTRLDALYGYYSAARPLGHHATRGVAGLEKRGDLWSGASYVVIAQYGWDTSGHSRIYRSERGVGSPYRFYRHALTLGASAEVGNLYELESRLLIEPEHLGIVASLQFTYLLSGRLGLWTRADLVSGSGDTWLARLAGADRVVFGFNLHSN